MSAVSIGEDTSSQHEGHLSVLPEVATNDPSTAMGTLPLCAYKASLAVRFVTLLPQHAWSYDGQS
jgi:hypothetical protein